MPSCRYILLIHLRSSYRFIVKPLHDLYSLFCYIAFDNFSLLVTFLIITATRVRLNGSALVGSYSHVGWSILWTTHHSLKQTLQSVSLCILCVFAVRYCMVLHTWRFLEIFLHEGRFAPKLGIFAVFELLDVIPSNCFQIFCYETFLYDLCFIFC